MDPDPANQEQIDWITAYLQQFHDALHTDPIGDYSQYMDLASFVDHFIINEITKDVDAYIRSHYMHKDRDGLLKAGPVWDYNFSLGNVSTEIEGWQWEDGRAGTNDWYRILAVQPEFMAAVAERWQELRPTLLADTEIDARIDMVAAPLVNAGPRDLERWPVGESSFGMGGGQRPGGNNNAADTATDDSLMTWEGQIADLKDWTKQRLAWLDSQLM